MPQPRILEERVRHEWFEPGTPFGRNRRLGHQAAHGGTRTAAPVMVTGALLICGDERYGGAA